MIVKARFVIPVDRPAIQNGAVAFEDGRIVAVGQAGDMPDSPPVVDYGDAVICPGFVNAHTHVELSAFAGKMPPTPEFTHWLARVIEAAGSALAQKVDTREAVRDGIRQSLASGVTMVGDIARNPLWTREVLANSPLRGVSYGEVIAIGARRRLLAERLEAAASTKWQSERIRVGISPHAPYTVEPDAMRACAGEADKTGAPLSIHLAETREEGLFTRNGTGPFADFLRNLGVWDESIPASGCGPVELAQRAGLLKERTVIAHANYVDDEDIQRIADGRASVAYCPRTHHAFGHEPHRFRDMLDAGINVCIGTDSLASNPSLSILDELRFLHRQCPDVPAAKLLAMGTLHGARALGLDEQAGSLTVGKQADLVGIPLEGSHPEDAWASILRSSQEANAVYISGSLQA